MGGRELAWMEMDWIDEQMVIGFVGRSVGFR
jgi:hypothetical protein